MKQSQRCPKCEGAKIYVIDQAKIPNYEYSNSSNPLTLYAHYGPTGEKGFFGAKEQRVGATIEAWVCAGCGYSELYASPLSILERFAELGVIRELNG